MKWKLKLRNEKEILRLIFSHIKSLKVKSIINFFENHTLLLFMTCWSRKNDKKDNVLQLKEGNLFSLESTETIAFSPSPNEPLEQEYDTSSSDVVLEDNVELPHSTFSPFSHIHGFSQRQTECISFIQNMIRKHNTVQKISKGKIPDYAIENAVDSTCRITDVMGDTHKQTLLSMISKRFSNTIKVTLFGVDFNVCSNTLFMKMFKSDEYSLINYLLRAEEHQLIELFTPNF